MWLPALFRRAVEPPLARRLILEGKAPRGLQVKGTLDLRRTPELRRLPIGLKADELIANDCSNLEIIPPDLSA